MNAFLLTPNSRMTELSNHKLLIHSLLDGSDDGNAPGAPACCGYVPVKPRDSSLTHLHEYSWAYVVLLSSGPEGAVTQLGEKMELYVVQQPGQVLVLPPGLAHRVRNTSETHWLTAIEIRTCKSVFDDRPLLSNLDAVDLDDATEVTADELGVIGSGLIEPPRELTRAERDAEELGNGRFH
jgi:uncharacterized RmlC-like cupin family protein